MKQLRNADQRCDSSGPVLFAYHLYTAPPLHASIIWGSILSPTTSNTADEMKRKRSGQDGSAERPSLKRRTGNEPFRESESVRERAKPYLLAVAKLHSDVLETTWSRGRNRRVEPAHVRQLKETFMRGGLERSAPENRIFVLCGAKEVRRILRAEEDEPGGAGEDPADGESNRSDENRDEGSFLNWSAINKTKVEVMAGQHRLHALREYIEATGAPESDSWWVCELYDRGASPPATGPRMKQCRVNPTIWQTGYRPTSTSSYG